MVSRTILTKSAVLGIVILPCIICILVLGSCGCMTTGPVKPASPQEHSSEISFQDMTGNTITLPHPADRIITTSTYATEYLIAIGAADKIIGNKDEAFKNPLLKDHILRADIVGSGGTPDFEKIVAMHPDIVLMPVETSATVKEKFRKANMTVAYFDYYSLDTMPSMVRTMGKITGHSVQAEQYLQFYQRYDDTITERLQNISVDTRPRVYYEMSGDYSTAGRGSGGYNYLKRMEVKNIAGDLPGSYPVVSPEWILAEDPDIIFKNCEQAVKTQNLSEVYDDLKKRPGFSTLSAIRNNRTYIVSSNILYGPRNIIGLLYLAKLSYPERFTDIDPDYILDLYAEQFFPGANMTETVYPTFKDKYANK